LLVNSPILAFPDYSIPFRLSVDSCCKGIGYMLYQRPSDSDDVRVIRFGSKALSRWQKSYGPTKLELLGMVTAVIECSPYLRTKPFILECDHQALKPLFSKQLKGAIYERWIAILQQYNFEIQYKPAKDMQVPDALSRCTREANSSFESPEENDPYFPYEYENTGQIIVPGGKLLSSYLQNDDISDEQDLQVNNICIPVSASKSTFPINNVPHKNVDLHVGKDYDGDTEDIEEYAIFRKRKPHKTKRYTKYKGSLQPKENGIGQSVSSAHKQTSDKDVDISTFGRQTQSDDVFNHATQMNDSEKSSEIFHVTTSSQACNDTVFDKSASTVCDIFPHHPTEIADSQQSKRELQSTESADERATDPFDSRYDVSDNTITNYEIDQESSPADSDTNANILKSIDIFRENGFSAESVHELQRKDAYCKPFIRYLEQGELPKFQKEARKLLLLLPNFHLINGNLFYTKTRTSVRSKIMKNYLLVLPEIMLKPFIQLYHDSTLGGHSGIQNTNDLIQEQYYYPNMSEKVTAYIRSCHDCQSRKKYHVTDKSHNI